MDIISFLIPLSSNQYKNKIIALYKHIAFLCNITYKLKYVSGKE